MKKQIFQLNKRRPTMKLTLNNGCAVFSGNMPFPLIDTPVDIEVLDLPPVGTPNYYISVKVNDMPTQKINKQFMIRKEEFAKDKLQVLVKIRNTLTGVVVDYKTDIIDVKQAVVFGADVTQIYPERFAQVQRNIDRAVQLLSSKLMYLEDKIEATNKRITEIETKNDVF